MQHALRAFTPQDADNLRKTARTFPMTDHYDVEKTITSLGIGEALVTVLSPKGIPTPLAATRLLPPDSLMGAIPPEDLQVRIATGMLDAKYGTPIDRESAHEIIGRQMEAARNAAAAAAGVDPSVAATMSATELRAAQKQKEAAELRAQREALKAQQKAERDAQKAVEKAQRDLLKEQQKMAREEQAARERAQKAAMRSTGTSRRRSKAPEDPAESIIRSVFGTLFGK